MIGETGPGVVISRSIPAFAEAERWRAMDARTPDRVVVRNVCPPGGAKVIVAPDTMRGLAKGAVDVDRQMLLDMGNISAPTVLFVLKAVVRSGRRGDLMTLAGARLHPVDPSDQGAMRWATMAFIATLLIQRGARLILARRTAHPRARGAVDQDAGHEPLIAASHGWRRSASGPRALRP